MLQWVCSMRMWLLKYLGVKILTTYLHFNTIEGFAQHVFVFDATQQEFAMKVPVFSPK